MPRNASGVFSLSQSAFVPNTTISSASVNADLSDIATALTQSLASTGVTSMTGQLKGLDGTLGAPGYTFAAELNSGLLRSGAGQLKLSSLGNQIAVFNSDLSVTWAGAPTFTGTSTFNGNLTINSTTVTFGGSAASAFLTGLNMHAAVVFVIDGTGSAITTGQKGHLEIPFACTIQRATLLADQAGSIVVNVWKTSYAGFPPAVGNKITAAAPPTISAAQSSQDSTLTGWTTALSAGDILAFNVDSAATITRVTLSLFVLRTGA
jgi:hypothetical protein